LFHVGDSRAYAIDAEQVECLTVDHVPATHLALIGLMDNAQLELFECKAQLLPEYVHERIALLMLCDINNGKEGEIHGRRRSANELLVYISYNEYHEILGVYKND
jgi:hypothetical protein